MNDAPVAADDSIDAVFNALIDISISDLLENDHDPDNGALLDILIQDGPSHGTLTALGNGGGWTYTLEENYVGSDLFTYVASDGSLQSNVATVNLVIPNEGTSTQQPGGIQLGDTQTGGTQTDGTQSDGTQTGGTQLDGTQSGGTQSDGGLAGLPDDGGASGNSNPLDSLVV